MKFQNVVAIFTSFYAIIVVNHITITKAEETTTEKKNDTERQILSYCEQFSEGRYLKKPSYTCCRNSTLNHPHLTNPSRYKYKDVNMKCALEMNKIDTDDLPNAMWREYVCITKSNGTDGEFLKTFRGYLDFVTRSYTEPYKSEIVKIAAAGKCNDADDEKDEIKRVEMFQRCLYRIERKVCHRPPANKGSPDYYKPKQYCEPEEDFPSESTRCCKGKALPRSSFVKSLEMNLNYTYVKNCKEQFINRQMELNPNIYNTSFELFKANQTFDPTKLIDDCWFACTYSEIPNKLTELKIEIEKLRSKMFKAFPKSTRIDLVKLVDKSMNESYIQTDNSTVSITDAVKSMDSKDELTGISLYCRVVKYIIVFLIEDSIKEYCYDEKISTRKFYY